jgi:uncharacterized protein DUF3108
MPIVNRCARATLLLCLLFGATAAAGSNPAPAPEVIRYHWRLQGLRGALAGFILPNQGSGSLTTAGAADGHLTSELVITAPASRNGEFWRYGAELDPQAGTTVRAWSSYLFRGERKSRKTELAGQNVMDVASGIYLLRRNPPTVPTPMRIWSDGKIYAVTAIPRGLELRGNGKQARRARHVSIVAAPQPGKAPWKGRLELWLTDDEAATPVEILIERGWAAVRLEMDPSPADELSGGLR